jgi:cytochrome P450
MIGESKEQMLLRLSTMPTSEADPCGLHIAIRNPQNQIRKDPKTMKRKPMQGTRNIDEGAPVPVLLQEVDTRHHVDQEVRAQRAHARALRERAQQVAVHGLGAVRGPKDFGRTRRLVRKLFGFRRVAQHLPDPESCAAGGLQPAWERQLLASVHKREEDVV